MGYRDYEVCLPPFSSRAPNIKPTYLVITKNAPYPTVPTLHCNALR